MTRRTYLALTDAVTVAVVLIVLACIGDGALPWVGGAIVMVPLVGMCWLRRYSED